MYDIITQIEQVASGSASDEIHLIRLRREGLDTAIKITLSINRLQHSLESILLLKKPTKDIPSDLLALFGNLSEAIANLPSTELTKRLVKIEESIRQDIQTIMGISDKPDVLDPLNLEKPSSEEVTETLHALIHDFRRRTNTAIVLKLHLRARGIEAAETLIPVTPEALVTQVAKLVVEEKKCIKKIKKDLLELDEQVGHIIFNKDYSNNMRDLAFVMHQQINANINHLDKGKDIESMPFVVEIIELGHAEEKIVKSKEEATVPIEEIKEEEETVAPPEETTEKMTNKPRLGFFKKLKKWYTTPWSVKWRDLE